MSDRKESTARPRAIPFNEIEWQRPEWADPGSEALVAQVEGFEFEIGRGQDPKTWDWVVKATAKVSETPGVIVSGTAKSQSGAQYGAKEHFNQHRLREWKRGREAERQAQAEQKAKAEQRGPDEAQMAEARKFLADQLAKGSGSKPRARKQAKAADKPVAA